MSKNPDIVDQTTKISKRCFVRKETTT